MDDNTCHLKIMNFSEADGGRYDCLMVLVNSHTALTYSEDKSNTVFLVTASVLKPPKKISSNDFGQFEIGVFYGILSLTIVIVVVFSAIVVVRVNSWCKSPAAVPPPHPDPNPVPRTLGSLLNIIMHVHDNLQLQV